MLDAQKYALVKCWQWGQRGINGLGNGEMTMKKQLDKDVLETANLITEETGNVPNLARVKLLYRHSRTLNNLYCCQCNGSTRARVSGESWDEYDKNRNEVQIPWIEKRIEQVKRNICSLLKELGIDARFNPDPRGYAVKMATPKTNRYNTWGGKEDGWGIG